MKIKNQFLKIIIYIVIALFLRFIIIGMLLEGTDIWWLQTIAILVTFFIGIGYIFRGTANVIEETTDVLKDRTKLAGGLLQSFGTAFPDMVIGVMAAFLSLQVRDTDPVRAINLAIIAASTTFGSNIYNIIHAVWCVYRQNLANAKHRAVLMFPFFKAGGSLIPVREHSTMPSIKEMDSAIRILAALTMLTAFTALSMVLFGQVKNVDTGVEGDLYQLIVPVGIVLFFLCVGILYYFRGSHHPDSPVKEIATEEKHYNKYKTWKIWLDLILAGVAILFTAESMVRTMETFSELTHIPFVVTGIMAGLIGCLGEILVVHNFSIHPRGRIGDAIVGVAMDNIVTVLGASIVAIMGGIFLGGNSLIMIFIIILAANTLLVEQISRFKNSIKIV